MKLLFVMAIVITQAPICQYNTGFEFPGISAYYNDEDGVIGWRV